MSRIGKRIEQLERKGQGSHSWPEMAFTYRIDAGRDGERATRLVCGSIPDGPGITPGPNEAEGSFYRRAFQTLAQHLGLEAKPYPSQRERALLAAANDADRALELGRSLPNVPENL